MRHLPFAIARVAGLEFEKIDALGLPDPADFERIFSDERLFRAELEREQTIVQQLSTDSNFQKSVLFASRDLFQNLEKIGAAPVETWAKKQRQTALGVLEYLVRMASKTSPLAGFTTLQLIDFQRVTSISEADDLPDFFKNDRWADAPFFENRLAEKSRASANALFWAALADRFLKQKDFARQLSISLNSAVAAVENGGYHFLKIEGDNEQIQLLKAAPAVDFVVDFLIEKGRIYRFSELTDALAEATDDEKANVETFLNQLVSCGLLVFELPIAGSEPGWAAHVYQRLAFFEKFEGQEAALAFLHFLNGTAKQLPFLTPAQLFEVQTEALARWSAAFGGSDFEPRGEAVWFLDAASERDFDLENGELEALVERLRTAARAAKLAFSASDRAFLGFFNSTWGEKGEAKFLDFARFWLEKDAGEKADFAEAAAQFEPFSTSFEGRKMAVALQPFHRPDGSLDAVVNRSWAGGGRGFARFLPLFEEKRLENLRSWNRPSAADELAVGFHGQHFSSANSAPSLVDFELDFPGSRPRAAISKRVGLRDLVVKIDSATGFLAIFHSKTGQKIRFVDLSLEAAAERTPVLQLLFELAAGPFSVPKIELTRRRIWLFEVEKWPKKRRETEPPSAWISRFSAFQKQFGLPRRCFFRLTAEGRSKPQLVDFQSVMSIQLFEKRLRGASGLVVLEAMLPEPDGFVFEKRAAELILEFEI